MNQFLTTLLLLTIAFHATDAHEIPQRSLLRGAATAQAQMNHRNRKAMEERGPSASEDENCEGEGCDEEEFFSEDSPDEGYEDNSEDGPDDLEVFVDKENGKTFLIEDSFDEEDEAPMADAIGSMSFEEEEEEFYSMYGGDEVTVFKDEENGKTFTVEDSFDEEDEAPKEDEDEEERGASADEDEDEDEEERGASADEEDEDEERGASADEEDEDEEERGASADEEDEDEEERGASADEDEGEGYESGPSSDEIDEQGVLEAMGLGDADLDNLTEEQEEIYMSQFDEEGDENEMLESLGLGGADINNLTEEQEEIYMSQFENE